MTWTAFAIFAMFSLDSHSTFPQCLLSLSHFRTCGAAYSQGNDIENQSESEKGAMKYHTYIIYHYLKQTTTIYVIHD